MEYTFGVQQRIVLASGEIIDLWPAADALAQHTTDRMQQTALRLYEQEASRTPEERVRRLGAYLRRWRHWTRAGVTTSTQAAHSTASLLTAAPMR